jgi:hypothetical protein
MSTGMIDVTRAGGELGQGFYTQPSASNAARWAVGRGNAAVLKIEIPDVSFNALSLVILNIKSSRILTNRLRAKKKTKSYTRGVDVIEAPLNGDQYRLQHKFESNVSQIKLNSKKTQRIVLP